MQSSSGRQTQVTQSSGCDSHLRKGGPSNQSLCLSTSLAMRLLETQCHHLVSYLSQEAGIMPEACLRLAQVLVFSVSVPEMQLQGLRALLRAPKQLLYSYYLKRIDE